MHCPEARWFGHKLSSPRCPSAAYRGDISAARTASAARTKAKHPPIGRFLHAAEHACDLAFFEGSPVTHCKRGILSAPIAAHLFRRLRLHCALARARAASTRADSTLSLDPL